MKKLNILMLGSFYHPLMIGGAETMYKIHAEGLAGLGHNVSVVTLGPNTIIQKEKSEPNLTIYRLPIKNIYWPLENKANKVSKVFWHLFDSYNPLYKKNLDAVLSDINPDIVVCESLAGWSAYIWRYFGKKQVPLIQIAHSYSFVCARGIMFEKGMLCQEVCGKCKLLTSPYRRLSKYVSRFVFVSRSQQQYYERMAFPLQSFGVVYNAEPLTLSDKSDIWRGQRAMRLGMVAVLAEHKGVLQLIKAFKLLKGDFTLDIGGNSVSEDFHQRLVEEIDGDPRIRLCGYVKADEFFKEIDLAIVPSICAESFGLVAVEACASQVPVVASDRGGLTEIIHDGVNGLVVHPEDERSIAAAVQKVYDDPILYQSLVKGTHASIARFIDVEQMLRELEEECYKVIEETV